MFELFLCRGEFFFRCVSVARVFQQGGKINPIGRLDQFCYPLQQFPVAPFSSEDGGSLRQTGEISRTPPSQRRIAERVLGEQLLPKRFVGPHTMFEASTKSPVVRCRFPMAPRARRDKIFQLDRVRRV